MNRVAGIAGVLPFLCLLGGLWGCGAEPEIRLGSAGTQQAVDVEMLGGGFVQVEGERIPVEELLYRLRQQARAADAADGPRPAIRLVDRHPPGTPPDQRQRPVSQILADVQHFSVAVRLGDD